MRHTKLQIFELDKLSSGINYLWLMVNYALNLVAYSLNQGIMPIHTGVQCPVDTSGNFYRLPIDYSRTIAVLKMPWQFWH